MSTPPQGNNRHDAESGGRRIHPKDEDGSASPLPTGVSRSGGECPVAEPMNDNGGGHSASLWGRLFDASSSSSWWNTNTNINNPTTANKGVEYASCPAAAAGEGGLFAANTVINAAASVEEAARHAQTPQPDQTVILDLERQVSSIPRRPHRAVEDNDLPHHQHSTTSTTTSTTNNTDSNSPPPKWVYPSEQQLYNAMRKKGWSNVPEESIPTVLQIHNHINEHTWRQIRAWEGLSENNQEDDSDALVLTRFQGRPRDLTPKAFFLSRICGRSPPFDRHDWYVQRQSSQSSSSAIEQRYVIDYYYLPAQQPGLPPIPYIDARPALMFDRPFRAVYLHARWWGQWAFPGIATYLQQQQRQRQLPSSNNKSNQINPQPQEEQP